MLSTVFYEAPSGEQEFVYASVVSFSNSAKRRAKEPLNINGICEIRSRGTCGKLPLPRGARKEPSIAIRHHQNLDAIYECL